VAFFTISRHGQSLHHGAVAEKMFVGGAPSRCSSRKNVRGRRSITVQ